MQKVAGSSPIRHPSQSPFLERARGISASGARRAKLARGNTVATTGLRQMPPRSHGPVSPPGGCRAVVPEPRASRHTTSAEPGHGSGANQPTPERALRLVVRRLRGGG
jgi:hypothetical protein